MRSRLHLIWLLLLLLVAPVLTLVGGCGDKIAIPEPEGLFGISLYREWANFEANEPVVDLVVSQGRLFILTADTLSKRNLTFNQSDSVGGLSGAAALCVAEDSNLVFVWEAGLKQVSWYSGSDLALRGSTSLPDVEMVVAMAVNNAGIDQVPGALTYLYLSQPDSSGAGVIHRYAFDMFAGLTSNGILARGNGDAVHFVHIPGGMATDFENRFLVCDVDTNRNWVIRFDGTPDVTDVALNPSEEDPQRGTAVPFVVSDCLVAPASDFVLGYAAICSQTDWVGRTGSAEDEFHSPNDVAVDGSGRIFVADTNNDRVQIFQPLGEFDLQLGSTPETPGVTAVGVYDHRTGVGADEVNFGAFVFVLLPGENAIRKFISSEHADFLNEDLPPPPQ
jgi:hypothetical protein